MINLSKKQRVILELLEHHGDLYPRQMVRLADDELRTTTIYVLLGRMLDKGLVTSERVWADETSAQPRRNFRIAGVGERALAASRAAEEAWGRAPA